jgi:hypothetical protein
MTYRIATANDVALLAEMNHQLIRDEGHRNPMAVPELHGRMKAWIESEYTAVLFARILSQRGRVPKSPCGGIPLVSG